MQYYCIAQILSPYGQITNRCKFPLYHFKKVQEFDFGVSKTQLAFLMSASGINGANYRFLLSTIFIQVI